MLTRALKLSWAAPYSALGLLLAIIAMPWGVRMQRRRGVLEFYGEGVVRLFRWLPNGQYVLALTLGHTILGQTPSSLDIARDHEHVHVRQFERWGPLMGPAYLGCSLWLWLTGSGRPYRDNPFEREAYDADDLRRQHGQ